MQVNNKSYRIRTNVGDSTNINVNLTQDYDTFEILSLKVGTQGMYKLHNSNYGVIVGRVLANQGFGVPNAKISVFIEAEFDESVSNQISTIYPFTSTADVNYTGKKYNLLPDDETDECHQVVGSFPNKTYLLDNDVMIEVFDKYYKYTTRTNNSGDYIICGVPTGNHTLHMDLDLSDCGILSQRPRDFVYKGYTIEQFENPNQFKVSDDINSLSQIISQDKPVNVIPFWGNESNIESIGVTRADINVPFTFEPTCIFMGCIAGDNQSNGISKKCIPTEQMGAMDELVTGEGTIEMIRKTMSGDIEEFQIKGTQLIDGNGVWCYQIPMNLDFVTTDEYGNTVATNDPSKGIPTRAQVRFRVSMQDTDGNMDNYFRTKVLVPHNPKSVDEVDYNFGTKTKDTSYRDLFWNNVYTVKSYIPRFQKSQRWRNERFSGIKHCNIYGQNNPMPYNNLRIRLPFMFIILCALIKGLIKIITFINRIQGAIIHLISIIPLLGSTFSEYNQIKNRGITCTYLGDGLCPDLDGWYFAPGCAQGLKCHKSNNGCIQLKNQTLRSALGLEISDEEKNNYKKDDYFDENSIDYTNSSNYSGSTHNSSDEKEVACLTSNVDYFVSCIEMNLAQEYKVIQFDFYNDWVNGMIYMPRWMRQVTKKRSYLFGLIKIKSKVKGCFNDTSKFGSARYYTQQCALDYTLDNGLYNKVETKLGCKSDDKQKCHKKHGMKQHGIFGRNGGIVNETPTTKDQFVYYFKPCEWANTNEKQRTILFANDLILLGTLNNNDKQGLPQAFKYLSSSSYKLPTNLALTNMDDAGYLYGDNNETVCANVDPNNLNFIDSGVKQLENTFSSTYKYGKNDINSDNYLNYSNLDDVIPLTEAAGIAWNYTGPGQGVANKEMGYQPGGHFLGLSCTNSETNIKSCINLQRVCEMGVNISQRREYIKSIDGKDKYTLIYHVPTGFIAKDEIIGDDFRSMFATLNAKRLIADDYDEKTGYPIYSFLYNRPNGFNGSYGKYVYKSGDNFYNYNMSGGSGVENYVIDEVNNLGIIPPADYDSNEWLNSITRTIEDANLDYYLFRMGLTLDNYKQEQVNRFLVRNGNEVSLPQYENSFYFYFGLKHGSTALDEFMKQFFSNCNDGRNRRLPADFTITTNINNTNMTGDITLLIENMVSPYRYTIVSNGKVYGENDAYDENEITFSNLPFGEYTITVTDSNNEVKTDICKVGITNFSLDFESKEFTYKVSGEPQEVIDKAHENQKDSGYIRVRKKVVIGDNEITLFPDNEEHREAVLLIGDENNYIIGPGSVEDKWWKTSKNPFWGKNDLIDSSSDSSFKYNDDGEYIKIYVWKPNAKYELYIGYCLNINGSVSYASIGSINVLGKGNVDLYMGSQELSYNEIFNKYNGEWWKDETNEIWKDNSTNGWLMRHWTFRQTLKDAEAFNSGVQGVSSTDVSSKDVLYGIPENSDRPYDAMMVDIFPELYKGYSLDDRGSVIPTFGPPDKTKNRLCFGKTVIDNNGTILGDALTSIEISDINDNGNECTLMYSGNHEKLLKGHGCVVQFNDNSIVYPIVNKNGDTMTFTKENTSINYEIYKDSKKEINVYPLFMYPVIYKPFYTEINFMESGLKKLILGIDEGAVKIPKYNYDSDNYSVNGVMYNGITFNTYFGNSTINGKEVELKLGEDINAKSDMFYNNEINWEERKFKYGKSKIEEDNFFNMNYIDKKYNFNFTEGHPEGILENTEANNPNPIKLVEISGEMERPKFYEYVSYDKNEGDTVTFMGYPINSSDKDINYYMVDLNGHKPFFESNDVLYVIDEIDGVNYIGGEYNDKAEFNNVGDDLFVKVEFANNEYKASFPLNDVNGVPVTTIVSGYGSSINFILGDVEGKLYDKGVNLLYSSIINTNDYNANDYYDLIMDNGKVITINDGKTYSGFNPNTSTIIGFKESVMEDGKNVMRVLHLYPDMINADMYGNSVDPYLSLKLPDPFVLENNEDVKTIEVICNTDWEITTNKEWCIIYQEKGNGPTSVSIGRNYSALTDDYAEIMVQSFDEEHVVIDEKKCDVRCVANKPSLELYTSDYVALPYEGGAVSIKFKCNGDWSASANDSWLSPSYVSGDASEEMQSISFDCGATDSSRSGSITIEGAGLSTTVTVAQSPKPADPPVLPDLSISPFVLDLTSVGAYGYISVNATGAWTADCDVDWCSISPSSGNDGGAIMVTRTGEIGENEEATGSVTVTTSGGSMSCTINGGTTIKES